MDLSSDSDDDCQLYTKTAEHFIMKRDEIQSKRRELEEIIELLPDDEYENVLRDNLIKQPSFGGDKFPKTCNKDVLSDDVAKSSTSVDDISDFEDYLPLAELSRNLRSRSNKRRKKSPPPTQQKRPKRNSRRRSNKQPSTPQVRNIDVIALDDDTGYTMDSLPPIDFNSRSHKKSRTSKGLENISVDSIISLSEDSEDDLIENDDLVTLTIEWNNGQKSTRKEFKLRRYQKFETVFEELAKMENISTNRVLLMYDFKSVRPTDTPSSLNLKFYGALIGSVSASEVNHNKVNSDHGNDDENTSKPVGSIQVKLLLQSKQTLMFSVLKHQKMDILYMKCAEELKCERNNLKLIFDGDYVEPMELVSDLDIEDGDVLHVHIKN